MISGLNAFGGDAHVCLGRMGDARLPMCILRNCSNSAFNEYVDPLPL